MKLITQTDGLSGAFSPKERIRILKEAGYDGIDWSFFEMTKGSNAYGPSPWLEDDWRKTAEELRAEADRLEIPIRQAHAPFPSAGDTKEYDEMILGRILRSMEVASILGVRNIIVHPKQHLKYAAHKDELFQINVDFYRGLVPYCEKWNIRVCAENMWEYDRRRDYIVDAPCSSPEEFNALLDTVDSPYIVGCLDLGHTALVGREPQDFIRAMGPRRLQALHVHDVDYKRDCHTLPFMEKLNWAEITKALGEIGYEGDFTFEADNFLKGFPDALKPRAEAFMQEVGRYLIAQVEAARIQ